MKKFIFIVLPLAILFSVWSLRSMKTSTPSLLLDNIEALAADEGDIKPMFCFGSGDVICPIHDRGVEYVAGGYSLE